MIAVASLLVLCSVARAGIVNLILDRDQSFLSYAGSTLDISFAVDGSPPGRWVLPYGAQTDYSGGGADGLVAHFWGNIYVAFGTGTIQTLETGKGYQIAMGSQPVFYSRGAFIPNFNPNDPTASPQGSPSGSYPNPNFGGAPVDHGNYGLVAAAVGQFSRIWDMNIGPSSHYAPNVPLPMVGPPSSQTFFLAPLIWEMEDGYEATVSGLGNSLTRLFDAFGPGIGFPIPLGGTLDFTSGSPVFTPNNTTGVWSDLVLTLNVSGTVRYFVNQELSIIDTRKFSGQLVYKPGVAEPSSIILACIGVVGLSRCARRTRRDCRSCRPG